MACQIKRDESGAVIDVLDQTGESSKLFRDIHGVLFLAGTDTSLKIFSNAYSDQIQNLFEDNEPILNFKTNGKVYGSLEDLLINESNGDIYLGFTHPSTGDFIEVGSVNNTSQVGRALTTLVRQGLLSAERVLSEDGSTRFSGKGSFTNTKKWTTEQSIEQLKQIMGKGEYETFPDGTFIAKLNDDFTTVQDSAGKSITVLKTDIPKLAKAGKLADPAGDVLEYIYEFDNPRAVDRDTTKAKKTDTDVKGIQAGLTNFLKSVGFTTTTLENYRANFQTKFGKDPDIRALADIANQIVAVNPENIEDLSEEVAHVALEMYNDQNSIASVLASVHNTPEYSQFYGQYKEVYSKTFEGVELEDHIRKEILGKILAKSIQERFSIENKTQPQAYVIKALREIWRKVQAFITNKATPAHFQALDILNERIANSIFNKTSSDFTADISSNTNFFYSLMDESSKLVDNELKISKRVIEDLYRSVLVEATPNQSDIDRLSEAQDEHDIISGVNTVVGIASQQMDVLKQGLKTVEKTGELLSMKDASRYTVLKENLIPSLNKIKASLDKVEVSERIDKKLITNLKEVSDELVVELSRIEPLMDADKAKHADAILEKELAITELTEEQKQQVRDDIELGAKDISWMGKMFGLATHSNNVLVQLIAKKAQVMAKKANGKFLSRFNRDLNIIQERDLAKHQKSLIKKDSHYILSAIDYQKYDEALYNFETEKLVELSGKAKESVDKSRKVGLSYLDILPEDKVKEYKDSVKRWKEQNTERRNTEVYYKERAARFAKAETDEATQNYLSTRNSARSERRKKYTNPDGTIDVSKQTAAENIQDDAERKAHNAAKSAYDSSGNIKPGLKIVNALELTEEDKSKLTFEIEADFTGDVVMIAEGYTKDNHPDTGLPTESRRALDLYNLDKLYAEESKNRIKGGKASNSFIERLKELEKSGPAFNWAQANSSIQLTSEYYDNLGSPKGFNEVAQEFIDSIEASGEKRDKQAVLDNLINLQRARKAALKQNKYANSTLETDVHNMTSLVRKRILTLDTDIADARAKLNVPYEMQQEIEAIVGESDFNEDYQKMLVDSGMSEYDFALTHMTNRNSLEVQTFSLQITDFLAGKRSRLKTSFDNFIEETLTEEFERDIQSKISPDDTERDLTVKALNEAFAKRHVASYFRRFQPDGYATALTKLKSGEVKVSDLVSNKSEVLENNPEFEFIEIKPDYSWSEELNNTQYLNPKYKEGVSVQPKFDKYKNSEFFETYGIRESQYTELSTDDLDKLTPTKNTEQYELGKIIVKLNEDAIENLGDTGRTNKYQRPQISKSGFEKRLNLFNRRGDNKVNAKDALEDLAKSKIDEKEYGEVIEGVEPSDLSVKVIPKYGQTKLGSPELVTDNILESSMENLKSSLLYKERVSMERDLKSLQYKISKQKFVNKGKDSKLRILKKGEVSNTYDKVQELIDYQLYGIKQNREWNIEIGGKNIDMVQVISKATGYVARVNLGYNVITDATSYTTGLFNNAVDTFSEDYYSKEAAYKASGKMAKLSIDYLKESGQYNKKSELNHLIEFFQVIDPSARLSNSAENRLIRMLGKSRFGVSQLANLPVTPKNMVAILLDHKFVDGRFKSFNDFVRSGGGSTNRAKRTELRAQWANMEETLYDNLDIDPKKGVTMGQKFKDKYEGSDQNAQEVFEELQESLISKITLVNQAVDAQISNVDKTMAHRDFATGAALLHRGWILTNFTRRFKGKQFNIATGQIEQGHYRGALKLARGLVATKGNKAAYKEFIDGLEEHEIRNGKRSMAETIAGTALVLIARALLMGDDDDDTAFENFVQLVATRTVSESQSSYIFGIPGTIMDTYEDPLVHARYLTDIYKGTIGGDPSRLKKVTLLKRLDQYGDLDKQLNSYRHFNRNTLLGVGE